MRILIIGGTGLISTAITRELLARSDDLWLYNRGETSIYAPVPRQAHIINGDRTDHRTFEDQMADAGTFDAVIDMVGYQPADAASAVRAFRGRVGQFIFCSTVDVYQKPATRYPYTESEQYGGLNAYSSDKVRCEQILFDAHGADFPVTVIRPAATYGEGRGPGNVISGRSEYVQRIRSGKPIIVHGDGMSLWVVCHRDDVGHAFVGAVGESRTFGRAYHATGEEWMPWDVYHQKVAYALGAPNPRLVHIPSELLARVAPDRARILVENFQFDNIFDNSAARADLGFRYTIDWVEGVRRMVGWLDEHEPYTEPAEQDSFQDRMINAWEQVGTRLAEPASLELGFPEGQL